MEIKRGDEPDYTLWAMIIQTRDVIFRARDAELITYGITSVEARALFIINLIGEQATPAMISRWMLREHNTVTALLKRMESKGLILKKKDPDKKNSWLISLTETGEEAYRNSLRREAIQEIFSVLNDEEHRMMTENLQKVCDQTFRYMTGVPTK